VKQKGAFWLRVHDRLKALIGLQLVACPSSPLHRKESLRSEAWAEKLRALYEELGGPDRFLSPEQVEYAQWRRVLRSRLGIPDTSEPWQDCFEQDPYRFSGHLAASCQASKAKEKRRKPPIDERSEASARRRANDHAFNTAVAAEIQGYARSLIAAYRSQAGPGAFESDSQQLKVRLVHRLVCEIKAIQPAVKDPVSMVEKFLASAPIKTIPFFDIASRLKAVLVQHSQSDVKPRTLRPSDTYDVQAISCYAPYCDAMFVDNEFRKLASQGNIDVPGRYGLRLFSENNRQEFMDYLDAVLAEGMSPAHEERLAIVLRPAVDDFSSCMSHQEK
jgi:hypothetical protein